ncbi:hypothetical protein PT974_08554 [Cladobotryum mycophilum]|uniref:RRM domain-containing protein n=1 Tax=Cladobotryum mycophilum TaxID=491253 RepID=A0ABR0SEM6_9HYPO
MSSKPSSSEMTIQADVAPGDKTGIYYITICNLPFGSSWQELKDWLRQACTVDHIELFQTSTSGWVRLRGKDNFEKAWKHINSVDFKGRSIIASDKNRTESIKIKELVESSSHSKNERSSPAPRLPYYQASSPTHYEPQLASTQYSAASYGQAISHSRSMADPYATAALVDPWTTYPSGSPQGMGYMDAGVIPTARSPYEGPQYTTPFRTGHPAASYRDVYSNAVELTSSNDYIATEPLKILITSISNRASPEETMSWIRRKTGPYAGDIIHIDVPPQDGKNRVRGHAYVIFKNAVAAQGAVQLLHQASFQGRKISARFTIEGVTADEQTFSGAPTPGQSQIKAQGDWIIVPPRQGQAGQVRQEGEQQVSGKKDGKSQEKKESKIMEKEEKAYPVIADGSSRRLPDKPKA